jgi:hypothetical protein
MTPHFLGAAKMPLISAERNMTGHAGQPPLDDPNG